MFGLFGSDSFLAVIRGNIVNCDSYTYFRFIHSVFVNDDGNNKFLLIEEKLHSIMLFLHKQIKCVHLYDTPFNSLQFDILAVWQGGW